MKPKRYRIKKAAITHISLVPAGKNLLKTVFKEKRADGGQEIEFATMVKANDEAGELLAVVYAPDMPDADGHEAPQQVIKEFAYQFLRDHRNVDIRHDLKTLPADAAYVAESFIIAKGDSRFADFKNTAGQPVDVTGGWGVVIKIEDPALRAAYRSGAWTGVSMFGDAVLTPLAKEAEGDEDALVQRVCDRLTKAKELQMTKEELQALLAENNKAVMAEVRKELEALKPKAEGEGKEPAKPAATEVKAPVFKGNVGDPKAVAAFQVELKTYRLTKELEAATASGDFSKVDEILAELSKSGEPEITDEEAKIEKTDPPKVRELKKELVKLQRASSQPDEGDPAADKKTVLAKERSAAAKRIAGMVNTMHGYPAAASK